MYALSDEDSEFRKIGRRLFDNVTARQIVRRLPHWAAVLLKPMVGDEPIAEFFVSIIRQTMEHRRKNNIRRNDFVDLLMDIKDHPEKVGEGGELKLEAVLRGYRFMNELCHWIFIRFKVVLYPKIQTLYKENIYYFTYIKSDSVMDYKC